jgi:site-specific recombinase XerD
MMPVTGRKRVKDYGQALLKSGVTNHTIRSYMSFLRSYFAYVLDHPYVFDHNKAPIRLESLYGRIEQVVSDYDIPQHSSDTSERRGLPMDPARLYDFYQVLRRHYLKGSHPHVLARNYAMVVLAGESGLRAEELMHLETSKDLLFGSGKLQTRFAKAKSGSGKRARVTLFPPLARDTAKFYIKQHRPHLKGAKSSDYLFPSKRAGHTIRYSQMSLFLKDMITVANKNGVPVLEHMSWHWFRRLFATRFIEKFPTELSVLMSLMGHTSPSTIHAYIHHSSAWMDDKIKSVIERVDLDGY